MIVEMYSVILIVIALSFNITDVSLPAITNNEVANAAEISAANVVVRFSER